MNQLLATVPFDIYELTLFQLVAETGSFTRAAERAGQTQSAITRQIREMEDRLGVAVFGRTTRHVWRTRTSQLLCKGQNHSECDQGIAGGAADILTTSFELIRSGGWSFAHLRGCVCSGISDRGAAADYSSCSSSETSTLKDNPSCRQNFDSSQGNQAHNIIGYNRESRFHHNTRTDTNDGSNRN